MQINHLRYFIALSDHHSITKASNFLNTTPQNVSRILKSLEIETNTILYNRTSEGVTLTQEGADFLKFAKSTVFQFDNLIAGFQNKKEKQTCSITLFSNNFINDIVLNDILANFQIKYPNIIVNNFVVDWRDGYRKLSANPIDIGFFNLHSNQDDLQNLSAIPVLQLQTVVILNKNHPLAQYKYCYSNQLLDYQILVLAKNNINDTDIFDSLNLYNVKNHSLICVGHIKACYKIMSTTDSLCIGTMEGFLSQDESIRRELTARPIIDRPPCTCALIKSPNLPQDSPQQLLLSYILNYIQEHPLNSSIQ